MAKKCKKHKYEQHKILTKQTAMHILLMQIRRAEMPETMQVLRIRM